MMPRVLLTGATGFIGREVLKSLVRSGCEVHSIGRSQPKSDQCYHHTCDLLTDDSEGVIRAIAATHLIHTAWYATPGKFWTAPENLDWVAASIKLTRNFAAHGGQRLVVTGSCAEYDWSGVKLSEEDTPIAPATLYGQSKASLFQLLSMSAPVLGLSLAWARIFIPYGPEESAERLLGSLINAIRHELPANFSVGTQKRDFIHVTDVAEALIAIMLSNLEGPVNIGSGETLSVRNFVERAALSSERNPEIFFGTRPLPVSEPAELVATVERLRLETSFEPMLKGYEGIDIAIKDALDGCVNKIGSIEPIS